MLNLEYPLIIGSRLLPAVKIGNATLSLDINGMEQFILDADGRAYTIDGFRFPRNGKSDNELVREAFRAFVDFATASNEAVEFTARTGRQSDNLDLFELPVREFLYEHSNEIDVLFCELMEPEEEN